MKNSRFLPAAFAAAIARSKPGARFAALTWMASMGLATADLVWDPTPGDEIVIGGAGTWDNATANWTGDGGITNQPWDNVANAEDLAWFTTGSGRVALPSDISLGGIKVSSPTGTTIGGRTQLTYVFEGEGGFDFGSQPGRIDTLESGLLSLQIGNDLSGSGGLRVLAENAPGTGAFGWIYLTGDNSGLSGGIVIENGLIGIPTQEALGGNAITLDGNAGLFGPVTIAGPAGTAVGSAPDLTLTNPITIQGEGNLLRVWGGRSLTLAGPLSGSGEVTRNDGGPLALDADNSGFTGILRQEINTTTTINGAFGGRIVLSNGTVQVNAPLTAEAELFGGTLNLTAGGGGSIINSAGTVNLGTGFSGELSTFGGTTTIGDGFTGTLSHLGGDVVLTEGTFNGNLDFDAGSLTVASGAVVDGNVTTELGVMALTVEGTVTGDLFIDDNIITTLAAAEIGGDLRTGFDSFSVVTINQATGPIQVGGVLDVKGFLTLIPDGSVPLGEDLITFGSLATDSSDPADTIDISGILSYREGRTRFTPTSIQADADPSEVVWTGGTSGVWDLATGGNWTLDGADDLFFNGDSVIFSDTFGNAGVEISPSTIVGDMTVDGEITSYTFTGSGLRGNGSLVKSGPATLTFSQAAGNDFRSGFAVTGGTVTLTTNEQATGMGPMILQDATLNSPPLANNATATFANSDIELINATWTFPGTSSSTFTHNYNFTGGEIGDPAATDPSTAIQANDSVLTFSSNNATFKVFNGRINYSGNNTLNRVSSNFSHTTTLNRAWYGDGMITVNGTVGGGATRVHTWNFAGEGSSFSGLVVLNDITPVSAPPVFNLNQALPASFAVRDRWSLVNNIAGGLDASPEVLLLSDNTRLHLAEPVNNPSLDVDLGGARLIIGNAPSTIGTLAATSGAVIEATGNASALTVTEAAGSVFAGTLEMRAGAQFALSENGIRFGEQTLGAVVHESGGMGISVDAASSETATIEGTYTTSADATLRVLVSGVPPVDTPVVALGYDALIGDEPEVVIEGLSGDSRISTTHEFTPTGLVLTFSGAPETLVWSGAVNGDWDTNTTQNWKLGDDDSAFLTLDAAVFNDTATGSTLVNVGTDVLPSAMTISNSLLDYTFFGTGSIIGSSRLTKSGTLTLDLANEFSGGTTLDSGRLALGTNSSLGSGPITVNGGTLAAMTERTVTLANPVALTGALVAGHADDSGSLTLSGPLTGAGELSTAGSGTLTLSPAADSAFTGEVTISEGTLSIGSNTRALGTGPLTIHSGGTVNTFPGSGTFTYTYGNSSIEVNGGAWNFGGSSAGTVTHTYNFDGGEMGSETATDPLTAIQINNGTLTLGTNNTAIKQFNGRIHWSGDNNIRFITSNFGQQNHWNRPWYGTGSITLVSQSANTVNRTHTWNFNGVGSNYTGAVTLSEIVAETNQAVLNLNQPIGPVSLEVQSRWNLVNHSEGALDNITGLTLFGASSRVTLTEPMNNPNLDLLVSAESVVNLGEGTSTVRSATVNGEPVGAGTYTSAESWLEGDGQLIVLDGEASGSTYEDWLASFGLDAGDPGTGPLESFDGSGVANIVQYGLGGDPTNPTRNGVKGVFASDAADSDALVLTIAVRQGAVFGGSPSPGATIDGIRYLIQGGDDVGEWLGEVSEIAVRPGDLVAPAGYQLRSFRLVETPALESRGFLRVDVGLQ